MRRTFCQKLAFARTTSQTCGKPRCSLRSGTRGLFGLTPESSQIPVADQLPALLVPKSEREGFETGEQRHRLHTLKHRMRLMTSFQIVIRNSRTQMMDVMKSN